MTGAGRILRPTSRNDPWDSIRRVGGTRSRDVAKFGSTVNPPGKELLAIAVRREREAVFCSSSSAKADDPVFQRMRVAASRGVLDARLRGHDRSLRREARCLLRRPVRHRLALHRVPYQRHEPIDPVHELAVGHGDEQREHHAEMQREQRPHRRGLAQDQ